MLLKRNIPATTVYRSYCWQQMWVIDCKELHQLYLCSCLCPHPHYLHTESDWLKIFSFLFDWFFCFLFCLQNVTSNLLSVCCESQLVSVLPVTHFEKLWKLKLSAAHSRGIPHVLSLCTTLKEQMAGLQWQTSTLMWIILFEWICLLCFSFLTGSHGVVAGISLPCACIIMPQLANCQPHLQ